MTLLAEAAAQAADANIDPHIFVDVLTKGGGAGVALERLKKCILTGDTSDVPFAIGNAVKDINYYREMVGDSTASRFVADGVSQAISAAVQENSAAYIPELTKLFQSQ
jgi:3-hydroxyisobutyrate dehydrogenase